MFFHDRQPSQSNCGDTYIQLLRNTQVSLIDLRLHALIVVHATLWHSISMCPCDKEDWRSSNFLCFLNELSCRRIHFVTSCWLDRWNLALLLQNHKIPFCRI